MATLLEAMLDQEARNRQQTLGDIKTVGALQSLMANAEAQRREQAFRSELAGLGPNPTQEQVVGIATKYGTPKDIMKAQQSSLDRQATLTANREAAAARLEQAKAAGDQLHELKMAQLKSQQDRDAEIARHNAAMENLNLQIAQLRTDAQKEKPPSGYRKTTDGNLEAIPGGPADTKLQGQLNQDTAVLNNSVSDMDRLATAANELLQHRGLGGITGMRGAIPNIPGTPAADAQAKLDTLKSQVGFSVLQNMRNNSKTGGALGQVSDRENALLQANLAALANSQSEDQMRESLQKIIDYTAGAKERLRQAYNMKHGDKGKAEATAAPANGGWSITPVK